MSGILKWKTFQKDEEYKAENNEAENFQLFI